MTYSVAEADSEGRKGCMLPLKSTEFILMRKISLTYHPIILTDIYIYTPDFR